VFSGDHDEFVYKVEQLETVETKNFVEMLFHSEEENIVPITKESMNNTKLSERMTHIL